jgi:cyclopropane fatty-acyl-phospholipid synthase-like methyltransferase
MKNKPYSEACDQNREPILAVLQRFIAADTKALLEIGSGTGQHAVYFAPEFAHMHWQTSDVQDNHPGIHAWLTDMPSDNVAAPLALDVLQDDWPSLQYDIVFSANTAHIMSETAVVAMFTGVGQILAEGQYFLLYGPFNIDGKYTAPSNERFDQWLKARDPQMGVRDVGWLQTVAQQQGLIVQEVIDMPADNKIVVWQKR